MGSEPAPGTAASKRELPKGLLIMVGASLLIILLLAGIIALIVSLKRSNKEKEAHNEWDEYLAVRQPNPCSTYYIATVFCKFPLPCVRCDDLLGK